MQDAPPPLRTRSERLYGRAFDALAGRPWATVGAMLLAAALGGWAATGAEADFSPQSVLTGRDDLAAGMEATRAAFGYEDAVLLVLLEDDRPAADRGDGGVLSAAALAWQQRLARDLPALPHVADAAGLATIRTGRLSLARFGAVDAVRLIPGTPDDPPTDDEAAWIREQLADGRADGLVSADRRTAAVLAILEPSARTAAATREVVDAVNGYLSNAPPPAGLTATVGGMPALRVAIVEGLETDTEFLFPLAGLLFLAALGLAFRRPVGVVVPLLGVGCGLAWAAGLLAAGGTTFGILSNVLPVLLTVIGFAAAVHILSRYAEAAAVSVPGSRPHRGADRDARAGETPAPQYEVRFIAARRTFAAMVPAVALTTGTTAVGFGSLLTANSDAVRAFAVQAAVGLGCLGVSTLLAFAALAPRLRPPRESKNNGWNPAVPVGGWAVRRPRAALAAGATVAGACVWLGTGLRVDSRMLETQDETHPAARAVRRVERDLGGVIAVEAVLETGAPGGLLEPDNYARVARLAAAARDLPGVLSVRTYTDILGRSLAGLRRDPAADGPPTGPGAAARIRQAVTFTERTAPGSTRPFLTGNAAAGRVVVRVADVGTAATLELADELKTRLNAAFPPDLNSAPRWRLTGDGYVNAVGMDRFVRDFLWGLAGASAVIFGAIGLLFRSVRAGLIAVVPNLAPLIFTLGYMRLRGLELNAGNAIVFAVGLGIAVDDTIHFLARFREELAAGADVAAAVKTTLAASGRAIVLTSLLILAGLSALLFSEFVPTRRFAELVCVTLAAALIGDLALLPAALAAFWKGGRGESAAGAARSRHP